MKVSENVNGLLEYVVDMRRKLHSLAELTGLEVKTRQFLKQEIAALGFKAKDCAGGILVDIDNNTKEGRANKIGLRCDMDALPLTEKRQCDFRARGNVMHACGHDGHMAMLLGVLKLIKEKKPDFSVRLIFQPAEEGGGGAMRMIEAGATDGLSEVYALHLSPDYNEGEIASGEGVIFAGTADLDIAFVGKSAHAAMREKGNDCIAAAVEFYELLGGLEKSTNNILLHVGKLSGGTARNIVADSAVIRATLRYFDRDDCDAVIKQIMDGLAEIEKRRGVLAKFVVASVYPPLENSAHCVQVIRDTAGDSFKQAKPLFTAEDFSQFCLKTKGAIAWLGIKKDDYHYPLHSDMFGFCEKSLLYGIELYKRLIYKEQEI